MGRPLFTQVPKSLAAPVITTAALAAIWGQSSWPDIAFGPFFLLICAFGAWFVGNLFAVLLGTFLALLQLHSGHAVSLQGGQIVTGLQFCSALAVVLMLGVARAALEIEWQFARVDPLTGALNRKAFFEVAEKEAGRAGVVVLIFADVDGLKGLNDRNGHEAGDQALRTFADRVKGLIRKDDMFARIGGDEFLIFLRVRDVAAANLVARRLNSTLNVDPIGNEADLRCSLGVLVLPDGSRSIDAELKEADALMYRAKRGRIGLAMAVAAPDAMQKLLTFDTGVKAVAPQPGAVRSAGRALKSNHNSVAA